MNPYNAKLALQLQRHGFELGFLPKNVNFTTKYEQYAKIPLWAIELLNKKEISRSAFQLYCTIVSKCYGNRSFTWTSKALLAKLTGISLRRIYILLNELIDAGLIAVHTQIIDGRPKSIIFILNRRNPALGEKGHIPSDRFILYSDDTAKKRQAYAADFKQYNTAEKEQRVTAKKRQGAYCQKKAGEVLQSDKYQLTEVLQYEVQDGIRNRCPADFSFAKLKKNPPQETLPIYKFYLNAPIKGIKPDIDIIKIVSKFINKYYMWVNKKFNLKLTPRPSDYMNISYLAKQKIDLDLFFKWIKLNQNDSFFQSTNKHASVWTSPAFIGMFCATYSHLFPLEDLDDAFLSHWDPKDDYTFDEVPN